VSALTNILVQTRGGVFEQLWVSYNKSQRDALFLKLIDKVLIREIVHLVGFYYKNISRCTVLWMSNSTLYCLM